MAAEPGHGRTGVLEGAALPEAEGWWRAGLLDGDGTGHRPDWAAFAEEATARAPEEAVATEGEYPGLSGFAWVLRPFVERAGERLERAVPARVRGIVDLTAVRRDLQRQLGGRLARTAARTLVLELYEARTAGRLRGDDPRARFRDFLGLAGSRRGLTALLCRRPVLARLLGRAALDAADALAETLRRLADDHALLTAGLLGEGRGPLVGVEPGAGDGHRGGRSVTLLRFADGTRLVYKPRPLAAHRHFNDLVAWFDALPGTVGLRTLRLLDRGRYGWVEHVTARPCADAAEVAVFYRRQGALLALLHLFDGTDLHHENLIAVGAHPVLVDVETLFHPPLPGAAAEDPAARALHDSVYRVGLLPQLLVGDDSALDVSAVGGGHAAPSPVSRAHWADAGTDRMRLVRRAGRFGESANRPRLPGGEPVEPGAHVEALCAGFRDAYSAIGAARSHLLGESGPLRDFATDEMRVVLRPTCVYTTLLDESTHPDLLTDARERQRVLETLRTDLFGPVPDAGLVDEEIAQLWAGDVPLFTARPDRDRVWGRPGRPPAGRTRSPGLARVTAKLAALDTVDRQDQEWIVRAAMATASRAPAHRPASGHRPRTADRAPEPERLLSAARSVGDRLVSLAYRADDRANWIGLELLDDRYWRIGPMPADLAGGYTGPALFLAQLAALTGAAHYAEAARTALTPVPALLDSLHDRPDALAAVGSGAFSGLGGIAYALAETARLLDDPEVASWAVPALRLAAEAGRSEGELGVGAGVAGGLVALTSGAGTGDVRREVRQAARACADRLADADAAAGGRGFVAGAAGIGWALLRFAGAGTGSGGSRTGDGGARTGDGGARTGSGDRPSDGGAGVERYRRAGLAALRAAVGGEPDDAPGARASAWCRGDAGIALAVLDAPGALDDPRLAAWARGTVEGLGRDGPAPDDSLCHGTAGLCELLGHSAVPEARPHWIRAAGALLASVEETGARSGAPDGVPHPGLLTGLAGIGHGLLRAGFPDSVPSLLLLRTRRDDGGR
ncbi:hypothetical protein SUDANB96_00724 [Streptomyces sp. enrichment culture]